MACPVGALSKNCARAPLSEPDRIAAGSAPKLTMTAESFAPARPLVQALAAGVDTALSTFSLEALFVFLVPLSVFTLDRVRGRFPVLAGPYFPYGRPG